MNDRNRLIHDHIERSLKLYPDAWRKEVEASLCRPKVASRIRDAVLSADRSERVRARRECSKRVKRRRGSQCGNASRTRELPKNTRRRGQRPSRRPRQVAASASTARAVRGSDIDGVEPPAKSRKGRLRAAVTGGPRRYEALPESVAAGCIARLGRSVLRHSVRHSNGLQDWRPPRCIPTSRGAASRNRELGPAPSEAREDPAASSRHPPPWILSAEIPATLGGRQTAAEKGASCRE